MRGYARSVRHAVALGMMLCMVWSVGCATSREGARQRSTGKAGGDGPARSQEAAAVDLPEMDPHVVAYRTYRDPLMPVNRVMFTFNDVTYRYVLIPVSQGYLWLVPDPVDRSIGNFFQNLREPLYAVNHLLQFRPARMSQSSLRFVVNSTIGLLGFFDPADAWFNLEREETGFDDTLARYGLGYGVYLVLPIFGPSDLRNLTGRVGSYVVSPIPYLTEQPVTTGVQGLDTLQDFAPTAEEYRTLRRQSDDPYIFFRNLYLQGVQRDAQYTP